MVAVGDDAGDLLDPESAAALGAWELLTGTTLKYAGWSARGYTTALLVSAYGKRIGESERKLVLKISRGGRAKSPEPRTHREAWAASPPDFRERHLVELPWDPIALPNGGWIMFQEIASGSFEDIRPLSTFLNDPATMDAIPHACATVVGSLLSEWTLDPKAMDPLPTAGECLRTLLGKRLDPGGTVRRWAEAKGIFQTRVGEVSPLALVLDDSLTKHEKVYVRVGNVHGDPHPGNILIPHDPAGYRLIDLSRFSSPRPLAFDPAYLLLTITARYLPRLSPTERDTLAESLVDQAAGARPGTSSMPDVLTAIVNAAAAWGARGSLIDEWRREILLNVLACALIMTGRDIIPAADRDWFYRLAQLATARYLDQPMPSGSVAVVQSTPAPSVTWADLPPDRKGPIETAVLPAGTRLWRVHPRSVLATEFVPEPTGRRSVLYASRRQVTAILEEVLRSDGERDLDPRRLRGLRLSAVRTTRDLVLAYADSEPDLAALWPPDGVDGIEWPSTQDLPEPTMMLLADRCPDGALQSAADRATDLDDPDQLDWLRDSLRPYRVQVPDLMCDNPLIFVTHYLAQDQDVTVQLDDELRARLGDAAVFQPHRSLRAGMDAPTVRLANLRAAKVLLVVFGESAPRGTHVDDWHLQVQVEISEALVNKVHIVPVLVARTKLTVDELPRRFTGLAGLHPLRLPARYAEQDIQSLVTTLLRDIPALTKAERRHRGE